MTNKTYRIHPAMGIARMGNADTDTSNPDTYFLGAESPFQIPNDGKPYKTGGRIKKQAQRFRIYEYTDGLPTREITLSEADVSGIEWTVEVGNRKAALDTSGENTNPISSPTFPPKDFLPSVSRNQNVTADKRNALCMNTGALCVSADQPSQDFTVSITMFAENLPKKDGKPVPEKPLPSPISKQVSLGGAQSEAGTGRLLVFASDGLSEGVLNGAFSKSAIFGNAENKNEFANSDNWYDTTGDGPVTASITFANGSSVSIDQPEDRAWVFCVLPKYAPAFNYLTNLQHVSISAKHDFNAKLPRPSFSKDIYPILRSVSELQWVSALGMMGHGTGKQGYYLDQGRMKLLSDTNPDPNSDAYKVRNGVFSRVRNPFDIPVRPFTQLTDAIIKPKQMPQLPNDVIENPSPKDWDLASVTKLQYRQLEKWAAGDFDPDPDGVYDFKPLNDYALADQPEALDRAAVAGSTGSPFYPGIESWGIMINPKIYACAMRIHADVQPGDLTMGNALPWQADYLDCTGNWWPVQRPDQVTRDGKPLQSWTPLEWQGGEEFPLYGEMVKHWYGLGFIYSTDNGVTFVEHERSLDPSTS